jgi:hypothetical protein
MWSKLVVGCYCQAVLGRRWVVDVRKARKFLMDIANKGYFETHAGLELSHKLSSW